MTRITALLLSLALGLPTPVFGMRPAEVVETVGLEELDRSLRGAVPLLLAGMEETDPAKILMPRREGERKAIELLTTAAGRYVVVIGDADWLGLLNKLYSKKLVNPVLVRVFQILKQEVERRGGVIYDNKSEESLIYRQGGDEFIIILPVPSDVKDPMDQGIWARNELNAIRDAVATELQGRFVVVSSISTDPNQIPEKFRDHVKAQAEYGEQTLTMLEVPKDAAADGRIAYDIFLESLLNAADPGFHLSRYEIEGNKGQFGIVKSGEKDFPVTISMGGQLTNPLSPGPDAEAMYEALRFKAEDWLNVQKKAEKWKNATAVGSELNVVPHQHAGAKLLTEPPQVNGEPLLLQDRTAEVVRGPVVQDFKDGRSELLLLIAPRYVWKTPLAAKLRDRFGYARLKAINLISLIAGDQMLQLLLAKTVQETMEGEKQYKFEVSVGRALSEESPDGVMVRLAWPKGQEFPSKEDAAAWARIERLIETVVRRIEKEINEYLSQKLNPDLKEIGLQVDLSWAGTVADFKATPELKPGEHFSHLQDALMAVAWQHGQEPNKPAGFLYTALKMTSGPDKSLLRGYRRTLEQADINSALIEAGTVLSASASSAYKVGLEEATPEQIQAVIANLGSDEVVDWTQAAKRVESWTIGRVPKAVSEAAGPLSEALARRAAEGDPDVTFYALMSLSWMMREKATHPAASGAIETAVEGLSSPASFIRQASAEFLQAAADNGVTSAAMEKAVRPAILNMADSFFSVQNSSVKMLQSFMKTGTAIPVILDQLPDLLGVVSRSAAAAAPAPTQGTLSRFARGLVLSFANKLPASVPIRREFGLRILSQAMLHSDPFHLLVLDALMDQERDLYPGNPQLHMLTDDVYRAARTVLVARTGVVAEPARPLSRFLPDVRVKDIILSKEAAENIGMQEGKLWEDPQGKGFPGGDIWNLLGFLTVEGVPGLKLLEALQSGTIEMVVNNVPKKASEIFDAIPADANVVLRLAPPTPTAEVFSGLEEITYQPLGENQIAGMFELRKISYLATVIPEESETVIDDYFDTPLGKSFLNYARDAGKTPQGIAADWKPAEGENHKIVGAFAARDPKTNKVIGYAYAESVRLLPGYPPLIEVKEIGVDPAFQQRGVGAGLVRQLMKGLVKAYPVVRLRTFDASEEDRTGRIARRFGFEELRGFRGELSDKFVVQYGVDVIAPGESVFGINPDIAVPQDQMLRLLESGVRIMTTEKLAKKGVDLAAKAVAARHEKVVLVPEEPDAVRLEPEKIHLFAHKSVVESFLKILPEGWQSKVVLTELPPEGAAGQIDQAKALSDAGEFVLIALDSVLQKGLELPTDHPLTLVLSPGSSDKIDRSALAAYLSRFRSLRDVILDLTNGTIERVIMEGKSYFAIFA